MAGNGTPLFPVTVVGSWPRPSWLLEALHKRQAGQLSFAEFNEVADKAVLEALRYQEEAGVDIVSDGEQRRDNFYSFVVEKLDGVKLMSLADIMDIVEDKSGFDQILRKADAPAFAIHNPTVVGKLKPRLPLALTNTNFCAGTPTNQSKSLCLAPTCWPAPCGSRAFPIKCIPPRRIWRLIWSKSSVTS